MVSPLWRWRGVNASPCPSDAACHVTLGVQSETLTVIEHGTYKTVKAGYWHWLSRKSLKTPCEGFLGDLGDAVRFRARWKQLEGF